MTETELRLLRAAMDYRDTVGDMTERRACLLSAAIDYGKAKAKAQKNRDRWKAKKRLGQSV